MALSNDQLNMIKQMIAKGEHINKQVGGRRAGRHVASLLATYCHPCHCGVVRRACTLLAVHACPTVSIDSSPVLGTYSTCTVLPGGELSLCRPVSAVVLSGRSPALQPVLTAVMAGEGLMCLGAGCCVCRRCWLAGTPPATRACTYSGASCSPTWVGCPRTELLTACACAQGARTGAMNTVTPYALLELLRVSYLLS